MDNKKKYTVRLIGIAESERHILRNIFKLSLYRSYSYTLADLTPDESIAILLVDADDPKAMQEWQALRDDRVGKPAVPMAMVTKEQQPPVNAPYFIRRPFVATRVLNVLDQIAAQELSRAPERLIGAQASAAATTPSEKREICRALVVDDSLPVRKQVELELKLFGIEVDTAESAERAFELIGGNSYDLIFLDVVLPGGMDGYQICKTIKKDKAIKKTPVVMLTSKSSPFDRVKGALAGCDTYLTKPVAQASFQKVVKKYLHR
ncbi:MAG: response regulator [Candidatus Competibacteraceae bacterium]